MHFISVAVISAPSGVILPMAQAIMSKCVEPNEQGEVPYAVQVHYVNPFHSAP